MQFEELLANPHAITEETIAAQRAELDEKQAATVESCKAYLADIEIKQGRIKAQADKYAEELAKLEALEKKQGAAVAQAVAKGDQGKAEKAEADLDATVEKIAALKKKRNIMTGATAKGEAKLYADAKKAMEATDEAAKAYRLHLEQLRSAAEKEAERLGKIAKELGYKLGYGAYGYGGRTDYASAARSEYNKVNRHFNDLDRKEAEARKAAAERAEAEKAEAEAKRNRFVFA